MSDNNDNDSNENSELSESECDENEYQTDDNEIEFNQTNNHENMVKISQISMKPGNMSRLGLSHICVVYCVSVMPCFVLFFFY